MQVWESEPHTTFYGFKHPINVQGATDNEVSELIAKMIACEAVEPLWDMREAEQLFAVSKNSHGDAQAILLQLQQFGLVELRKDSADSSQWRLTADGMQMLDARVPCKNPKPLFCAGAGQPKDWTPMEALCFLKERGWEFTIVPRRKTRARIPPYAVGSDAKFIYVREGTFNVCQAYLVALCSVELGLLSDQVLHMQKASHYKRLSNPRPAPHALGPVAGADIADMEGHRVADAPAPLPLPAGPSTATDDEADEDDEDDEDGASTIGSQEGAESEAEDEMNKTDSASESSSGDEDDEDGASASGNASNASCLGKRSSS